MTAIGEHLGEHLAKQLGHLAQARSALESGVVSPLVDDDDAEELRAVRERGMSELRDVSWHHRCPQRFHLATLDQVEPAARAEVEAWMKLRPRPNLVLLGPVGTGKTYTALAAAREDHYRGIDVLFLPVVELLDVLRPGGDERIVDDVMHCSRLVIDDVGHERPTDWTAERLGAIVNRRWLEELPVIATTNLEPSDLRTALGERTYSRLVGDGAVVVRLSGSDRRRSR